jgi:hypothetical protein
MQSTAVCAKIRCESAKADQPEGRAVQRIMLDGAGQDWKAIEAAVKAGRRFRDLRVRMAMGYADGPESAWPAEAWAELAAAGAQLVRVTVTGQAVGAEVGDCERGDLDPAGAAAWAQRELNAGHRFPVIYTDRSAKPAVIGEATSQGLKLGHDYGLLVATLDGSFLDLNGHDLRAFPGVVGVQYLPASRSGGPFDVTLVTDDTWLPEAPRPWTAAAAADLRAAIGGAQLALAALEEHTAG